MRSRPGPAQGVPANGVALRIVLPLTSCHRQFHTKAVHRPTRWSAQGWGAYHRTEVKSPRSSGAFSPGLGGALQAPVDGPGQPGGLTPSSEISEQKLRSPTFQVPFWSTASPFSFSSAGFPPMVNE